MSGFSQLPVCKIYRSSSSRVLTTGSDRSYNVHRVNVDMDKDVSGCKSLQEYALKKLFEDDTVRNHAPLEQIMSDGMAANAHDFTLRITLDSPATVQKKRRAPDPPASLLESQIKFSSIDDLLLDQKFMTAASRNASWHPLSVSSNRLNTDFWGESLFTKPNSKSPSPTASPKLNRTKNILRKLKSPMAGHRHSRKAKRVISKEEEEAGFILSSNGSSFDEPDGFTTTEDTVFFAGIPSDLERDVDFQVQRISDYNKYLHELLQETDPDHQDYEYLKQAVAQVRSMVKNREDELGNMDNQMHMERVQDKFPYDDLQLRDIDIPRKQLMSRRKSAPGAVLFRTMSKAKSTNNLLSHTNLGKKDTEYFHQLQQYNNFNRNFLMEGIVEFSRSMQTQDRYLFLFTDLLLVAKQKSNTTFKLKYRARVAELWISDCVDDVTELTCFKDKSFVIGWPTTNYVATFKSPELKETWLNKLKEQILKERSKFLSKTLPLEVQYTETDQTCKVEVEITTDVLSVVKECLEHLNINESNCRDYQLWVRVGPDESPYPLCGHELPYAIKMSHLRDYCKQPYNNNMSDLEIQQIINEIQSNNRKNEFFLKFKKSQKQHCLEDHPKPKAKKISPLINIFRKYRKKPQGKLFCHPLADVTSADMLIAKPVKELLTILFRNGPDTVGILRKSCNAKKCRELKQKLDDGEDCLTSENCPALVIGALFKDYLRSIPQSLLKEELFEDWVRAINITDEVEKFNKFKDTVSKLPAPHYELLRHLMCVLYHIDKNSKENKMTAYNLSLCIAPSLLWQKGNQDPLATPAEIIQYMIENCAQIFGEDSIHLFGDRVEHKMRQDSSTDSDSMHHILNSQSNLQRDNSSLDSLEREFYSGEIDYSPNVVKSQHFSPSDLSGDSGLISDSQFYDEDGNEMIKDKCSTCSISHVVQNNENRDEELEQEGHGSDAQYSQYYSANNPVPPPRRPRRKTFDSNNVPSIEDTRELNKYIPQDSFIIKAKYESCSNLTEDRHKRSSELLKSVEERSVTASERHISGCVESNIGTLRKSASGSHLYFEEMNVPQSCELQNLKELSRRRNLYKVASAMLISPQSKNSLSSSHDSVLSDSSELYLNRQNSSEQNSSSPADTPEREECGMLQWLNQHSYNLPRQTHVSHDDIDVGLKMDKKLINKMNYIVSPKTSPKVLRCSPIPLCGRSLPLHVESPIKGNDSHSFNAADDTIKVPEFLGTSCLQDSVDGKSDFHNNNGKTPSPHLDVYNNNAQIAMKQLNIYSSGGLQGISPCPRIVLHGLSSQSQAQRRDNIPLKGNHNILNTAQRCSLDSAKFTENRQKYPMEESSISSEDENVESDSEHESFRVMTMIKVPLNSDIPQKVVVDSKCSSSETSYRSSNQRDDGYIRRENPPDYAEAVHRNKLLKQGLAPDKLEVDPETVKQREASVKAKQLYEQSMIQYEEQKERCPLPTRKCERKLDAYKEQSIQDNSDSSSSDEEEEGECNARRLYEESLKRYNEQQQDRSPLHKTVSEDKNNVSVSNNGEFCISNKSMCQSVSDLNQSRNDLANIKEEPRSLSHVNSFNNRDLTPKQQPNQPSPYNDPLPYHCERAECTESNLISAKRHIFSRAGAPAVKLASRTNSPQMVNKPALETTSPVPASKLSQKNNVYISCQNTLSPEAMNDSTLKTLPAVPKAAFELTSNSQILNNAQPVSVHKQRVGVSVPNRTRNMGVVSVNNDDYLNKNITHSSEPDNSVKSAQSEIGIHRLQVPNGATSVDLTNYKVKSVGTCSNQSASVVFKPHTALIKQKACPVNTIHPQTSSQGPVTSRNPDISKSFHEVNKSLNLPTNNPKARRSSLDAAISQCASVAQTELPWSVKRLSNIFDTSKSLEVSHSQLNSCSHTVAAKLLESSSHLPSHCTPPSPLQRNTISVHSRTSNSNNIKKC